MHVLTITIHLKIYWELNKGKASTAKQTYPHSLLGLEMNAYRKDVSSLGHLPCQLDLGENCTAAIMAFTVSYSTVSLRI